VVALVLAGTLAKVGSRTIGGGGPFVHAGDCGSIVAAGTDRALADVNVLANHIEMDEGG
jgi:hypothetical protein